MDDQHLSKDFDAVIAGAGPAGLVAGLAFAELGFACAVIGPQADPADGRSAALFKGSIDLLKRLGAWPLLEPVSEPLAAIRLIDATGSVFVAPEVTFRASEIGEPAFGYNVPNAKITSALEALCQDRVTRIKQDVSAYAIAADSVELTLSDGRILKTSLVAGADGRNAPSRAAAGIKTRAWSYDQCAIVCTFSHARAHKGVSTEFHRRAGPLTVVPGGGNTSNLVWVETAAEAERLKALTDDQFSRQLSSHLSGLLGTITLLSQRRMFALSGQTAEPLAANRVALIGEAGHVMPPIGAQGLNLSFRDAATLAEFAAAARDAGGDIGAGDVLAAYAAARRSDVTSRVWTIDLLNRSLLSPYLPVHMLRGLGLFALNTVAPLRHRVMREGISPSQSTPNLMRPSA